MCGIAGIIMSGRAEYPIDSALKKMASAIAHRGPDDEGIWFDVSNGVGLAHRRLAIVDLSPSGHQPMHSECGRFVLVFNGEIYNHLELRIFLEKAGFKPNWKGHSDTETMLSAIVSLGFENALKATVGMFSISLWDKKKKILYLARDRMGEKPLYYGMVNNNFVFGSELKAIRALPSTKLKVDRNVIPLMMKYSYIPEPYCIYEGLKKLEPGTWLEVNNDKINNSCTIEPNRYWSTFDVISKGNKNPIKFSNDNEAVFELDQTLRNAVKLQMMADVPLGAFLSGGVDSSTVVALMQAQTSFPIKTFSIGFDEESYNEAHHARNVAQHLGTDHTEMYVTPSQAMEVIPQLPDMYDEPFSDVSQIPTHLVSKMARKHVTVCLSGDGGDELFGGYNRYFLTSKFWNKLSKIPLPLRRASAGVIKSLSPMKWDTVLNRASWILPNKNKINLSGDRLHKVASVLASRSSKDIYLGLITHWNDENIVINSVEPTTKLNQAWPALPGLTEQMMALDSVTYLPGDILTKVDRAAMAVSLETRIPMLDHRVIEFTGSLPLKYKVRDGEGKWLLKQVLYKYVPRKIIDRPKMGFGVPIDNWLRGSLFDWAESLINSSRLKREGYLNSNLIEKKWKEHHSGNRNWQYLLWDVLMFQSWLDYYKC